MENFHRCSNGLIRPSAGVILSPVRLTCALCLVSLLMSGCGVSRERYAAQVLATRRANLAADELETERRKLLKALAALEARLSELEDERGRLEAQVQSLEASLAESEATAQTLREITQELQGAQRQMVRLTEEISSVFYDSAIERAQRGRPLPTAEGAESGAMSAPIPGGSP